jgi:hypothetical protein
MYEEHIAMGCTAELRKIASGKDVGQLLSDLARRSGQRPSMIPSIRQVSNVAQRDRGRAAEIASNIRTALKTNSLKAA